MATDAPNSYKDPYWSQLASNTEQKLGLPDGLLSSIVLNGEKSNADQVSDAGAKTPFQITPSTRKAAIDKYGIDPYLSPENAAEVAGNLLKDSLQRNDNDPAAAIGEYHGGTDRANWGAKTKAYVQRVMSGIDTPAVSTSSDASTTGGSTFDRVQAQMNQGNPPSIANVYAAYKSGQMTPQDAADFEKEVGAGTIMLPRGASLNPASAQPDTAGQPPSDPPTAAQTGATAVPDAMVQAYKSGQMSDQDRQDFESLVKSGELQLPQGVDLGTPDVQKPTLLQKVENLPGAIKESITGTQRTTPEVQQALDQGRTLYDMPETNQLSWGVVKSGLGGMFAGSKERAQILAHNFPGVTVREDSQGNQWLKSPTDGKEYVIPPGFKPEDIPRTVGTLAAFTPAGRAGTAVGMGLKSAATQAAIEGSQAATGGNFDPGDVLAAGAMGTVAIPATNAVKAVIEPVAGMLQRLRGAPEPIINPAQQAVNAAPEAAAADVGAPAVPEAAPQAAPPAPVSVPEAAPAAAPAETAPVAPMPAADLAQTAKKAAEGGIGSKGAMQALAEQTAPDAKTVEAAKRLGIEDYLQPDHVTTNQAYRELAQAVKSVPGSEARAAELQGLEQVAQRADKLIDDVGGTQDLSSLDANVKGKLQSTQQELEARANKLYQQVREGVPASTPAPADSVINFVQQRADDLGGADNLSPMESKILSKLSPKADGQQPTYALLDDVRKDLGAAARQAGPFKDADTGLAKKLYSLLSDDQAAVVNNMGMSDTYNAARQAVAVRKGIEDDLSALFGRNLDQSLVGNLNRAVNVLPSGDSSQLVRLLKSVPEDMRQEVVASGLNSAFGKSARNGAINFNKYSQWYDGLLRNKQAYTAVMSNLPTQARKQLSDLYRVSKGIGSASKERITTGRINAVIDQFKPADNLVGKLYETARHSAVGAVAGTAITPVLGPGVGAAVASALTKGAKTSAIKAVDSLITTPEFINLAKQAGQQGEKAATLRLIHSKPFTRFVSAVGQPRELSNRERWVLQAMQANNQQR